MNILGFSFEDETYDACIYYGPYLNTDLSGIAVLLALSLQESSGGFNNKSRIEPAYSPGGKYYNEKMHSIYGDDASASWGPFQIMFQTAIELGFDGNPVDLSDPMTCAYWATIFINERILKNGAQSIEEIADAYNTGSFRDSRIPHKYIENVSKYYYKLEGEI